MPRSPKHRISPSVQSRRWGAVSLSLLLAGPAPSALPETGRGRERPGGSVEAALPSSGWEPLTASVTGDLPGRVKGVTRGLRPVVESLAPFGTIRNIAGGGDRAPVVVHVHDVHANESAQRNNGRAIARLQEKAPVEALALEGAFGPLDVDRFRRFPDRAAMATVADYLLARGRLSGPLHAVMTSSRTAPALWGVDDPALHAANVKAYRRADGLRPAASAALARARADLAAVEVPKDLRALDAFVAGYHAGREGLGAYLSALFAVVGDSAGAPVARAFLDLLAREKGLNFPAVADERRRLLDRLVPQLGRSDADRLVTAALDLRSGTLSHAAFYASVERLARSVGLALGSYPHLRAYADYVRRADEIDAESLYAELPLLEDAAYRRAAGGGPAGEWARRARRITLYEKLAAFALTPPEWGRLRADRSGDAPAGVDWSAFRAFYERADDRDRALAEGVVRSMRKTSARRVVLVAGGYHAAGVRAALIRAGMSVVDFAPRVETVDDADGRGALSVFVRGKTPLEKLFRGDRLFLAPAPFAGDDQERARLLVPLVRELADPNADHVDEDRDIADLAFTDSPELSVRATDQADGAALTVRNEATGGEVRVTGRLDDAGGLTDVRESAGTAEGRDLDAGESVDGVEGLFWGDRLALARARRNLAEGRGAVLSHGERRRLARDWVDDLRTHGDLGDLVFFSSGDDGRPPTLERAVRSAIAVFQADTPRARDGRIIEFWAVDAEGLDPRDRGVGVWSEAADKRTLRFRKGDLAAVLRALLEEEILPGFGLEGPARALDRRGVAVLAEEILTGGLHMLPEDPWNFRPQEEARFRDLGRFQRVRALRAAAGFRGRLVRVFASRGDLAEEYWAVRTERFRDAGPSGRSVLESLLGWFGRARRQALREGLSGLYVPREELRVRFHRLTREAGVATHLAPTGLSFGLQEGLSQLHAAVRLKADARSSGVPPGGASPLVVDGVSRGLREITGPFVLFQKLPNGRDAFPVWLDGVHRRLVGETSESNGAFFETLAGALPSPGSTFARLTPALGDSARLYLEGGLSFAALNETWEDLFKSADLPPRAGTRGLRLLFLIRAFGSAVGEAFDRGVNDLATIYEELTPTRRLGRSGWNRLNAADFGGSAKDLADLYWDATVDNPPVALGEGADRLFQWLDGTSREPDAETALRDHVVGWRLTSREAASSLPRLAALARNALAAAAPAAAYTEAAHKVFEDIQRGTVDPSARAVRWTQALGFLSTPGRYEPSNPEEPNPDLDVRVFENTLRRTVFSADAFFTQARAVREVVRWERGERGLLSGRRVRAGEDRFPWIGRVGGGVSTWGPLLAMVVGAGLWSLPGSALAAGGTVFGGAADALWPVLALAAGSAAVIHGTRRAVALSRRAARRAGEALGDAVAAGTPAPLDAVLAELEAAPLSLDVDGAAFLRVVRERGWERRRDFVETARTALRARGVGMDFASVRAAMAPVFAGEFPTASDVPVLRVWLADAAMAGRVPRAPGADVLIVALDDDADRALRAAGHTPAPGAGLVRDGALFLSAVERLARERGFDPARFAACRVMVPMSLPVRTDGARSELFQRAIVVLMDALRAIPLRPMDLDALDRVARAIASAA